MPPSEIEKLIASFEEFLMSDVKDGGFLLDEEQVMQLFIELVQLREFRRGVYAAGARR